MKCQTKMFGYPCDNEATHIVSGIFITPHLTCKLHLRLWLSTASKDEKIYSTPIDNIVIKDKL